ncbi:hypothetical protein D3C79_869880 [compost metagenome]
MQITVETGDLGVLALLQVEHRPLEYLRQGFATAYHQQRLLETQCLDHAGLNTAWQAQLPLATPRRCGSSRLGRIDQRLGRCHGRRRHRRFYRFGPPAGQGAQRVVGKG